MPKKDLCEIVVLLDRSGSMASIAKDMEGGFDTFVAEQKKLPGECVLTLVQFDHESIDNVHEETPISKVGALHLHPRGNTPLLDAMGKTINRVGERLRNRDEDKRPDRVVFFIITDGQENASREFSKEEIKAMVQKQTNVYKWQFVYLGANVDAFDEARNMGIPMASAGSYSANSGGVRGMMASASAGAASYRSTGKPVTLSDEDRKKMVTPK